jgi:hypothetical protein
MRRGPLVSAAVVAVLAAAAAGFTWEAMRPAHDELVVEVTATATPPIPATQDATVVWTGEEFLVWGGGTGDKAHGDVRDDGAAYDPATDTWRMLAPSPLEARERHTAVWTGAEMVVWGGTHHHHGVGGLLDGARYDPETDTWRPMADAPPGTDRSTGQAVMLGGDVVIGGGYGPSGREETLVLRYDLDADRWETFQASAPVVQLVPTGDDLALLTSSPSTMDGQSTRFGVERLRTGTGDLEPVAELVLETAPFGAGLLEHDGRLTLVVEPGDDEPSQLYAVTDVDAVEPADVPRVRDLPGPVGLLAAGELAPIGTDGSRRIVFAYGGGGLTGVDLATGDVARVDGPTASRALCRNGGAHAIDGTRLLLWGGTGCGVDDQGDQGDQGPALATVTWRERDDR